MTECQCGGQPDGPHTDICYLQGEIERLRAELTEARKPDCRLCRHLGIASKPTGLEYECILAGTNAACADGHKYTGLIPVRLYEKEGK